MSDSFNPYYAFLGLDEELTNPNYYQLLRLKVSETDPDKINAAADKAAARIRSQQPGEQVKRWSQLLDEVKAGRACLLNPEHRAAYNEHLDSDSQSSPNTANNPAPSIKYEASPQSGFGFPPGVGTSPAAYTAPGYSAPAYSPPAPTAQPWNPAAPAPVDPMAPMAYGWPQPTPPAGPAFAPPVGPERNAFDPMAPVTFPVPAEQPGSPGKIVGFAAGIDPHEASAQAPFATKASPFANLNPSPLETLGGPTAVPVAQAVNPLTDSALPTGSPSRTIARKPSKMPMPLVLGMGGLVFLFVCALVGWSLMGEGDEELASNDPPVKPAIKKPKPNPEPSPEKPVEIKPAVRPQPEPKPEPDPEMMQPEPPVKPVVPEPKPEPKPEPMPTPAELAELSRLMNEAKTALGDFTFDEAETALAQAAKVAKAKEHVAMVTRLQRTADMAKQFRDSIREAMAKLEGSEVIKISNTTEAAVVEASPQKITIRLAGTNRTYSLNDLPLGLAVNLGERALNPDAPSTKVFKGAFVLLDKRAVPAQIEKAKTWWEEAESAGENLGDLMLVFDDSYDFEQE